MHLYFVEIIYLSKPFIKEPMILKAHLTFSFAPPPRNVFVQISRTVDFQTQLLMRNEMSIKFSIQPYAR